MSEKLENALMELAAQLGTTVEHLWGVLVRQAQVEGVLAVLTLTAIGAVGYGLYRLTKKYWCKTGQGETEVLLVGAWVLGVIFAAIPAAFAVHTLATSLVNPEYWALQRILGLL